MCHRSELPYWLSYAAIRHFFEQHCRGESKLPRVLILVCTQSRSIRWIRLLSISRSLPTQLNSGDRQNSCYCCTERQRTSTMRPVTHPVPQLIHLARVYCIFFHSALPALRRVLLRRLRQTVLLSCSPMWSIHIPYPPSETLARWSYEEADPPPYRSPRNLTVSHDRSQVLFVRGACRLRNGRGSEINQHASCLKIMLKCGLRVQIDVSDPHHPRRHQELQLSAYQNRKQELLSARILNINFSQLQMIYCIVYLGPFHGISVDGLHNRPNHYRNTSRYRMDHLPFE